MITKKKNSIRRCPWVDLSKVDYVDYHDKEWGVPVYDDRLIFEFLTLESAQAGLSWYTVLKKRENYRRAFENFKPEKIARFDPARIEELLQNPGIIRNRLKIEATVNNAQKFLEVQATYGSFSKYIWSWGSNLLSLHFNQLFSNLTEFLFPIFRNVKIKDLTPCLRRTKVKEDDIITKS